MIARKRPNSAFQCGYAFGAANPQISVKWRPFFTGLLLLATVLCLTSVLSAQQNSNVAQSTLQMVAPPNSPGPPVTVSLQDALERAAKNSPQFQAAVAAVNIAHEGRVQARAAMLPALTASTQYLNSQGNGISPVGRFVTNDGIHVYRAWGIVHEDMPASFFISAGPRGAAYAEALAKANQEIARRGLVMTVTNTYYALVVAERKYATAEQGLGNAQHLLSISQDLERGGEVAQADVIRFQIEENSAQQALRDAEAAMSTARLNLSVLLFPNLNQDFTVVDDLGVPPALPSFAEVEMLARNHNPDVQAALAAMRQANLGVATARTAFLPSIALDLDYGIEANAFALYSDNTTRPGIRQPNLGYFATYALNVPVFDWGSLRSKLHQAKDQRALARVNLSFAERQTLALLYSYYNEAQAAWGGLDTLRNSAQLATRNLQLVTLQYKAGEVMVPSVLDAETALTQARNAYADGQARYRAALASLQTITGSF
ncbi:MAG TPA: TolC family protein [Terriglobia bacterium]|nr:TolC family protein [Terriglobia bacterium]